MSKVEQASRSGAGEELLLVQPLPCRRWLQRLRRTVKAGLAWPIQRRRDAREMEIFDVMTEPIVTNVSGRGAGPRMDIDDNIPELLGGQNQQARATSGRKMVPISTARRRLSKMQVADGMQVNLFASEEMFPGADQSGANGGRYRQPLVGLGLAVLPALESNAAPPRRAV